VGDSCLVLRQSVAEESGDVSLEVCVSYIGHFSVIIVNLFDDIGSNDDLRPHNSFLPRTRVIACFGPDVELVFVLEERDGQVDEVSSCHRPYSFVVHVVDFEHIELLLQHLNLD
jgi:hypothetical protein